MSLAESLTNLVWAPISTLRDVKCSANWMWPAKLPGEGAKLVTACQALCSTMNKLGVAIDGGKDSLSMAAKVGNDTVKSPGTVVITAYAPCTDICQVVTPDLKGTTGLNDAASTNLIYIRFGSENANCHRLGGTSLAQCYKQIGDNAPDLDDVTVFVRAFRIVQDMIKGDHILSGHDVSDGGLITCILEMAFAGNCSILIDLPFGKDPIETLFSEELGVVVEISTQYTDTCLRELTDSNVFASIIGITCQEFGPDASVKLAVNNQPVFEKKLVDLREIWEETSHRLELRQCSEICAIQEKHFLRTARRMPHFVDFEFEKMPEKTHLDIGLDNTRFNVAILREEGSNGDREMAAAFYMAGFHVFDVTMSDLLQGGVSLRQFRGIAFVGGFSYADVLGSAKGWASAIKFHENLARMFDDFRMRDETFSLGVCNGCQLMALLGWVGNIEEKTCNPTVFLEENDCRRFQSYFSTVVVEKSPAIMLRTMEKSIFGVWVSHGEGKFVYKSDGIYDDLSDYNLIPIRYVDENGQFARFYPNNPNGSVGAVAAICSRNGRHLAMMPHPERSFLKWQLPVKKFGKNPTTQKAPWMKMFTNAFDWCFENE